MSQVCSLYEVCINPDDSLVHFKYKPNTIILWMLFVWISNFLLMKCVCTLYEIWVLYDFCMWYEIWMSLVCSLYEVYMTCVCSMGFVWILYFWHIPPFYTTTKNSTIAFWDTRNQLQNPLKLICSGQKPFLPHIWVLTLGFMTKKSKSGRDPKKINGPKVWWWDFDLGCKSSQLTAQINPMCSGS